MVGRGRFYVSVVVGDFIDDINIGNLDGWLVKLDVVSLIFFG